MKNRFNNNYVRWGLTAFAVIASCICFYYAVFHSARILVAIHKMNDVLLPIFIGFVMAYLMTPILNQIEYRFIKPIGEKLPFKTEEKRSYFVRAISIILTTLLFFLTIFLIIGLFISQIVPSIRNLIENFDVYVQNVINMSNKLLEDYPDQGNYVVKLVNSYSSQIERWMNETVFDATGELIKTVSLSVISVLGILWDGIIGIIISIYLMASKEKFAGQAKKIAYAIFSQNVANDVIKNFRFMHKTFSGFISGKVIDSLIIGLLCFIGTSLMGTPYAALVSLLIGVTNIIPFFGPFLGAIPCAVLILLVDPMHPLNCVYFVIFILILQQFDGNVIGPKILGDSTGLASFWVLFSIIVFGGFFGVLGMIVGVPIFAIIYAWIKAFITNSLQKKNMPMDTDSYLHVDSVNENEFIEYTPKYKKDIDEQRQLKEKNKAKK